mmetsp:Transcript_46018/g.111435  ORF Transcript_46018/g.111435 Transcript_46018/m.111435 type:complete len:459 (-) Transcript_46018:158-1534(-)
MKVSLPSFLLCCLCCLAPYANAFSLSSPRLHVNNARVGNTPTTRLYYDIQREPSNENVWNVLATTERWISEMLNSPDETPLSRKEVSYVCEAATDTAMVLANVFRKLKEARQMGEAHGEEQEELQAQQEGPSSPSSIRQTQVLVIPSNVDMKDWAVFDNLIAAVNQARRSARDYVTDVSLDRLDLLQEEEEDNKEWVVSVNCAHLHPEFGKKTPEQELKELQLEEDVEIDLNLQEYKEKRLVARRSPFPSIVVEVRAMPPPVFTPPPPKEEPRAEESLEEEQAESTMVDPDSDFVQALEMLFSKSSLNEDKSKDASFYDSIGSHLEELTTVTPLSMAQTWISQHDDLFDVTSCAFTTSDTPHVDEAYEFLFTNLAMQSTQFLSESPEQGEAQKRQYLVLHNFCPSSATSTEKFLREADNIIRTLPSLRDKVKIECLHPEHVQEDKRCPIPVFVLQWTD